MALTGALVLGLLLDLGDAEEAAENGASASALPLPAETRGAPVRVGRHEIKIEVPRGWRKQKRERGVRLRDSRRMAEVAVFAVTEAGERESVMRHAVGAARDGYKGFRRIPVGEQRKRVSGRPALMRAFEGVAKRGEPVRGLLATVSASGRTYLVEVFTAVSAPAKQLVEAQLALESIELR